MEAVRPLNARSLVLSILLGRQPPELPAAALVRLGALFGIAPGTMRTALSRMAANGELAGSADGYRLVGRLLERKAAQDSGRHAAPEAWDGAWVTVLVTAPRRDSTERRAFRTHMANLRMGELRPDTWLRPDNLAPSAAESPAVESGVAVLRGSLAGVEASALVAQLWQLDALATTAEALQRRLDAVRPTLAADITALPGAFTLAAEVVRFLRAEPLLPPELCPQPWPPDRLRVAYDGFDRAFGSALADAIGIPRRRTR